MNKTVSGIITKPIFFSQITSGFGRKEVVEYLLQYGADVHAKDDGELLLFHFFSPCTSRVEVNYLSKPTSNLGEQISTLSS